MKQTKQFLEDTVTRCDDCGGFIIYGKPHRCETEEVGTYSPSAAPEYYYEDRDEPAYEIRQAGDEIPLGYPVIRQDGEW